MSNAAANEQASANASRSTDISFPSIQLNNLQADTALVVAALHLVDAMKELARWYGRGKRLTGPVARGLRLFAVIFAVLGALGPVAATWFDKESQAFPLQIGYVLVALAGLLVAIDRFLGYTSAFVRYSSTFLALDHRRLRFETEWSILVGSAVSPVEAEGRLRYATTISACLADLILIVEKETAEWATEFKANLSALDSQIRADTAATRKLLDEAMFARDQAEQARQKDSEEAQSDRIPGWLELGLSTSTAGPYTVEIDGKQMWRPDSSKSWVTQLPPGKHKLQVTNGAPQPTSTATIVELKPDEITKVLLTL